MTAAQLILMGIRIAAAVAAGIPAAVKAKEAIDAMVDEGRDPTDEEWAMLNAATDQLHARVQGDTA